MSKKSWLLSLLLCTGMAAIARSQTMDPDYAAKVKEWTTRPEFLSPLVDHLPKSADVPSPKDVLGYYIGEPKRLTYNTAVMKY